MKTVYLQPSDWLADIWTIPSASSSSLTSQSSLTSARAASSLRRSSPRLPRDLILSFKTFLRASWSLVDSKSSSHVGILFRLKFTRNPDCILSHKKSKFQNNFSSSCMKTNSELFGFLHVLYNEKYYFLNLLLSEFDCGRLFQQTWSRNSLLF